MRLVFKLILYFYSCLFFGLLFELIKVLKGVPDRPEVVLVKLREIKSKLEKRTNAQDNRKNIVSVKDIVRVLEGPCKVSNDYS